MSNGIQKGKARPWPQPLRSSLFHLVDEVSFATGFATDWQELCETSDGPSRDRAAGYLIGLAAAIGGGGAGDGGSALPRARWRRKARALLEQLAVQEDGDADPPQS